MCQVAIPYVVPAGSPVSVPLPVFALGEGSGCGCDTLPDLTTVTVFRMDDQPIPPGRVRLHTDLRGTVRGFLQDLRR